VILLDAPGKSGKLLHQHLGNISSIEYLLTHGSSVWVVTSSLALADA
jgi:hypothetical protein